MTTSAIRIIIETDDDLVKRLPWHCWHFLQDYPDAEIALSRPPRENRRLSRTGFALCKGMTKQ